MKASELRNKSEKELREELTGLFREQFSLRMQRGSGQDPRNNQFGVVRKNIARIKTILNEKNGVQA